MNRYGIFHIFHWFVLNSQILVKKRKPSPKKRTWIPKFWISLTLEVRKPFRSWPRLEQKRHTRYSTTGNLRWMVIKPSSYSILIQNNNGIQKGASILCHGNILFSERSTVFISTKQHDCMLHVMNAIKFAAVVIVYCKCVNLPLTLYCCWIWAAYFNVVYVNFILCYQFEPSK